MNEKDEAELLGSAVLIQIASETFLCTAKHVIDKNACSPLYFDGPSKPEALVGDFFSSKEHDISILKLTIDQIELFQKYNALTIDHIATPQEALSKDFAYLLGFPAKQNRPLYNPNKTRLQPYSILGTIKDGQSTTRVHVSFSQRRNIDAETRKLVMAPDPHGMSGGPIFGIAAKTKSSEGGLNPKLIGIISDWPRPANEMFGTSVAVVMSIISKASKS